MTVSGGDKKHLPLALAALGVVFGDIGTSPLYAFETALGALDTVNQDAVLGVASLVIWCLLLIVTFKYVLVVLRADYHGEGGVFALLALLQKQRPASGVRLPLYVLMLLFGAALLFGDGTITPAISVLSAMEGLEAVDSRLLPLVLPGTVAILLLLFAVQRLGTGRLGLVFGGVMLLWFLVLAGMGLWWVLKEPGVLRAFNPAYALEMVWLGGWRSLVVMGAVVLAVTGVEALYADLGHFNRRAISLAWHGLVLPALVLNYLGQAALALNDPTAFQTKNPFFHMVPSGASTIALVVLATAATVIASQALISGVFSLTAQAQELNFLPRFVIRHTSRLERGQVFVPLTNFILALASIMLVLTFRSSENLAAAYGLAVVGTMVITSLALILVTRWCWQWRSWQTAGLATVLLSVEIPFLLACLTKFPEGGYFPLLVASAVFVVMLTWHDGRVILLQQMKSRPCSAVALAAKLEESAPQLAPGQLVFITANRKATYAVARAFEMARRGGLLRQQVVLMSLVSAMDSDVDMPRSISVQEIGSRLWHVTAQHGYRQEPHAPEILARARDLSGGKIQADPADTFYVLGRELIVEYTGRRLARWRRALFGFLSRNVSHAPDYYFIPHEQMIVFTWMMRT